MVHQRGLRRLLHLGARRRGSRLGSLLPAGGVRKEGEGVEKDIERDLHGEEHVERIGRSRKPVGGC